MKKLLILGAGTLLLNILFFSIFPLLATAQGNYTPLAPIKIGGEGGKDFVGDTVQTDDLSKYVNNMFRLGIAAAVALAVLMIIVGGIEYMSTDAIGKKQDGQARINAALLGLVVALGSYMLLNTINPNILNTEFELDALENNAENIPLPVARAIGGNTRSVYEETDRSGNRYTTYENGDTLVRFRDGGQVAYDRNGAEVIPPDRQSPPPPPPPPPTATSTNGNASTTPNTDRSEQALRDYFAQNNIGINSPPCTPGQTRGCTNLNNLGQAALQGLVDLRDASGAPITITGGTEDGHREHREGRAIVDLRLNPTLNRYITTANGGRRVGGRYVVGNATYLREGDHWHVTFGGGR